MHYPHVRRAVEIALVLVVSPVALSLGLLAAGVVMLDSAGGVFFVQTRPGKHGRPFKMVKFRTMKAVPNQPFRLTEVQDTRLTRTGRWMRAMHLDEIPQLWHVLTGEMSLIGPRPVPMELYAEYAAKIPGYDARHAVAPGITGLAQVSLGYINTLEGEREKWQHDAFYIAHQSAVLDAWILWATMAKLLGIRLSYADLKIQKNAP